MTSCPSLLEHHRKVLLSFHPTKWINKAVIYSDGNKKGKQGLPISAMECKQTQFPVTLFMISAPLPLKKLMARTNAMNPADFASFLPHRLFVFPDASSLIPSLLPCPPDPARAQELY